MTSEVLEYVQSELSGPLGPMRRPSTCRWRLIELGFNPKKERRLALRALEDMQAGRSRPQTAEAVAKIERWGAWMQAQGFYFPFEFWLAARHPEIARAYERQGDLNIDDIITDI